MARMGDGRDTYRVLVGRPGGKRIIEMPKLRWEDYIKNEFQEVGCEGMD